MDKSSLTMIFMLVIILTLDYVELTRPKKEDTVDLWEAFVDTVRDVGRQLKNDFYSNDDGSNRHRVGAKNLRAEPYINRYSDKIANFFNALHLAYNKPWYPFKKIQSN